MMCRGKKETRAGGRGTVMNHNPASRMEGLAARFLRGCCRSRWGRHQRAAHPCRVPDVGSQLVSGTGLDCLALSLHHTEPVLERFGGSTLLLERTGIQTVPVPGRIPDH